MIDREKTAGRDPDGSEKDSNNNGNDNSETEEEQQDPYTDRYAFFCKTLKIITSYTRNDVHAVRFLDKSNRWAYRPVAIPIDSDHIDKHLGSGPHVGVYLFNSVSDKVLVAVLDLDDHDGTLSWEQMREKAAPLLETVERLGLKPLRVRSGGGRGIHFWFYWKEPQSAAAVRTCLQTALAFAGLKDGTAGIDKREVEIFPKQDRVPDGRYGNLVALPFARESVPLNGDLQPTALPSQWPPSAPITEQASKSGDYVKEDADTSDVIDALSGLPSDDYDRWIRVGLALKREFGEAGYEVWDEWSKKGDKYDGEATTRKRWDGFTPRSDGGVTIGSIFHWAREAGWKGGSSKRPSINYDPTDPKRMAGEAEAVLLASGRRIYQKLGKLVRVVRLDNPTKTEVLQRDAGAVVEYPANPIYLTAEFMSVAKWIKRNNKKVSAVPLPRTVADTYIQMVDEWKVPILKGTVETPTLYKSGDGYKLLQTPGYDLESQLFYDPGNVDFPLIPEHPTRDNARDALDLFSDLFCSFPFVPDDVTNDWQPDPDEGSHRSRSRSVALSAILTGLMRRGMDGAPLHAIDAVSPGTGKSYIIRVCAMVLTGRMAAVMPWIRNEEEQRKRILSVLMEGDPIILLDNATASIGGAPLNILLSEPIFKDRILGKSASAAALTNCLVFVNGNNLEFEADTTRRVARCRLDARCERPQDREFLSDPLNEARNNRPALVSAGLTILLAYIVAGRPERGKVKSVGSYEDWTLIREALVWLDQPDPADTMKELSVDDPVANDVRQMMEAWWTCYGSGAVKLSAALKDAREGRDESTGTTGEARHALFEAMHSALKGKDLDEAAMGRWFKKRDQLIVDGRRFVRGVDGHKVREITLLKPDAGALRGALNTPKD